MKLMFLGIGTLATCQTVMSEDDDENDDADNDDG